MLSIETVDDAWPLEEADNPLLNKGPNSQFTDDEVVFKEEQLESTLSVETVDGDWSLEVSVDSLLEQNVESAVHSTDMVMDHMEIPFPDSVRMDFENDDSLEVTEEFVERIIEEEEKETKNAEEAVECDGDAVTTITDAEYIDDLETTVGGGSILEHVNAVQVDDIDVQIAETIIDDNECIDVQAGEAVAGSVEVTLTETTNSVDENHNERMIVIDTYDEDADEYVDSGEPVQEDDDEISDDIAMEPLHEEVLLQQSLQEEPSHSEQDDDELDVALFPTTRVLNTTVDGNDTDFAEEDSVMGKIKDPLPGIMSEFPGSDTNDEAVTEESDVGIEILDEHQGVLSTENGNDPISQYDSRIVANVHQAYDRPTPCTDDIVDGGSATSTTVISRDYTKIYKKYFHSRHMTEILLESKKENLENGSSPKSGFARPWGTVLNFFKRKRPATDEGEYLASRSDGSVEKEPTTVLLTTESISPVEEIPTFLDSLNPHFKEDVEDDQEKNFESFSSEHQGDIMIEHEETKLEIYVLSDLRRDEDYQIVDSTGVGDGVVQEDSRNEFASRILNEQAEFATDDLNQDSPIYEDRKIRESQDALIEEDEVVENIACAEVLESAPESESVEEFQVDDEVPPPPEIEIIADRVGPVVIDIREPQKAQVAVFDMDEENFDSDEEVDFYDDHDADEYDTAMMDVEPSYSSESSNLVWRFLIGLGLEQLVMMAILVIEWFRLYLIDPILESADLLIKSATQQGLQGGSKWYTKWLKTRGGSISANEGEESNDQESRNDKKGTSSTSDLYSSSVTEGAKEDTSVSSDQLSILSAEDFIGRRPSLDTETSAPKIRPNRLYRYLLGHGYLGHVLIMDCILAVEWLGIYVPFIPNWTSYMIYEVLKIQRPSARGRGESAVLRTSGFLGADGRSVRAGKKKKAQTKREDQKALDQLKKLGDVKEARYLFLSQSFMKRHSLGPYSSSEKGGNDFHVKVDQIGEELREYVDEDAIESDSEWIVEALTLNDNEEESLVSPVESDLGLSFGSDGPTVSIGVGFSIGENPRNRPKKPPSSLSSIVRQSQSGVKRKKTAGPRVSDRDSGVLGRLRAAGASSLMGRNLLGAYPGDLPPPHEAADPSGLYDLARRYGYGNWSDDDDDDDHLGGEDEDDDNGPGIMAGRKPRKKSSTKERKTTSGSPSTKRKKRRRRSYHQDLEIGFNLGDIDLSPSKSTTGGRLPRNVSPRSSSATVSSSRIQHPPKALELLSGTILGDNPSSKKANLSKPNRSTVPSKRVRPAMSLLDELRKKDVEE
jgi:hypothetical protein